MSTAGGALLALDAGNSQISAALFDPRGAVLERWRLATEPAGTADELAVSLLGLLRLGGRSAADVGAVALAATVPTVGEGLAEAARRHLGHEPVVIDGAVDLGLPLRVDDPRAVGPDRIANALAARAEDGAPCVVVDLGTATNLDAVAADGAFVGGAIAAGVGLSVDALAARAARLPRVPLTPPATAIGVGTEANIRSGAILGAAGLVDGLVTRFRAELGGVAPAIATGGFAALVAPHCATITRVDALLTLRGVRLAWLHARGASATAARPQ